MSGYDDVLAEKVMAALEEKFPHSVSNLELKRMIEPEPRDDELLTALQALQIRKLIDGKGHPRPPIGNQTAAHHGADCAHQGWP